MKANRSSLSPSELDVMKVLWEEGPGTVREINARLGRRGRTWVYTTVQTLLGRLEGKGHVTSDKSGFAHIFRPTLSREALMQQGLAELAEQLCDGAAVPLVLALVQGQRFTAGEIEQFRALLDTLENRPPPPKRRSRRTKKP